MRQWEQHLSGSSIELPTWSELRDFLEARFRSLEMIDNNKITTQRTSQPKPIVKPKTFHTNMNRDVKTHDIKCAMCSGEHYIYTSTSISARDLGVSGDSKVFVRAALSPTTAYLLWRGKTDLKEKSLCKYVWCKDGLVMVRKNDGDKKVYYVRSANDIETIKKELLK